MAVEEKLVRFNDIINRKDFSYICNPEEIKNIAKIFKLVNYMAANDIDGSIDSLDAYSKNLTSFYEWIETEQDDIVDGYELITTEINKTIDLLKKRKEEDIPKVSGGYLAKFKKNFLYGISRIYAGLIFIFRNKSYLLYTRINIEQMARYILNGVVGLKRKYEFNAIGGEFGFVQHLGDLSRNERAETIRVLEGNVFHKQAGDWIVLGGGRGADDVRIHTTRHLLRKSKVYRIYRVNGGDHVHHDYDLIHKTVNNSEFKAA